MPQDRLEAALKAAAALADQLAAARLPAR